MARYRMELMTCTNRETNRTTYYINKCGVFTRICKEEYDNHYDESDGLECAYTKTSKMHVRSYRNVIYEN